MAELICMPKALLEAMQSILLLAKVSDCHKNVYSQINYVGAFLGKLDIAKYLLEKGANINSQNDLGYTGLHWCVGQGDILIGILKF